MHIRLQQYTQDKLGLKKMHVMKTKKVLYIVSTIFFSPYCTHLRDLSNDCFYSIRFFEEHIKDKFSSAPKVKGRVG